MKLRRIIVAVFPLLAIIAASLRGGPIVYAFLYASLLLPVGSFIYTAYVFGRLKLTQRIESRFAVKNQPVGYTCRLGNETLSQFTPVELGASTTMCELEGLDKTKSYMLAPGENIEISCSLVCKRRGDHPIGITSVLVRDALGIFNVRYQLRSNYRVTVYPRVLHLDALTIFDTEGGRMLQTFFMDEQTTGDTVREYIPGDDPRLIHWKNSARTGDLQVRQVISAERPSVTIVFDTRRAADAENAVEREDNMLEALLAICRFCCSHGLHVDVRAGRSRFLLSGDADFAVLYDWSCHMLFDSDGALDLPDSYSRCAAVLTTVDSAEAADSLTLAAKNGSQCALLIFDGAKESTARALALKSVSQLRCYPIADDADISAMLQAK